MPDAELRKRLSVYGYQPTTPSEAHAVKLVNEFLDNFSLTEDMQDTIDVMHASPCPVAFTSPAGEAYFDLVMLMPFIESVLERGKEWYGTRHGDRFTLLVKGFLQEQVSGIEILDARKEYRTSSGERSEVDLLLMTDARLIVVECKAYAKSKTFMLGSSTAVSQRNSKHSDWVAQARKAAKVITECMETGAYKLPKARKTEWIVCTPAQEFIKPLGRYGMLTEEIPRICTPEELVTYLKSG